MSKYKATDRLTRKQAAEVIGVSVSRLAQLRRAGFIQHEKNPHTSAVRYVYADVLRLKQERETIEEPDNVALAGQWTP